MVTETLLPNRPMEKWKLEFNEQTSTLFFWQDESLENHEKERKTKFNEIEKKMKRFLLECIIDKKSHEYSFRDFGFVLSPGISNSLLSFIFLYWFAAVCLYFSLLLDVSLSLLFLVLTYFLSNLSLSSFRSYVRLSYFFRYLHHRVGSLMVRLCSCHSGVQSKVNRGGCWRRCFRGQRRTIIFSN